MFKGELFTVDPTVNSYDNGIESEVFLSQFKSNARKYFPKYFDTSIDPMFYIRTANKFFEVAKNSPINEFFIRFDHAPLFWIYNSPVVKFFKNFYRLSTKIKSTPNSLISFLDYYEKWAKVKTSDEIKYFAGQAEGILEYKNLNKNIFIQLQNATIRIFDKSSFDPAAATDILNQTFEAVLNMNLDDNIKNEICYYINIYTGFSYLAQNVPDKAGYYFTGALVHKQDGINAKFYSALANVKQMNIDPAAKLIEDLFDTDLYRLRYALSINDHILFSLLCDNNIIQNVFAFPDFAQMMVDIHHEINGRIHRSEMLLSALKAKMIDFSHIEHMVPKDPIHSISFQNIDFIIQRYSNSHNLAFLASLPMLEEKFYNTINEIITNIEGEFEKRIQEKLAAYTMLTEESNKAIAHLTEEIQLTKNNVKTKVERMVSEMKTKLDQLVLQYEEKIKNLEHLTEFSPILTFKNGMSYNIFFSVIVLLVAGFASYSNNNNITEISNFKNIFSSVILTGTKWGIIAFILGLVFNSIQAGSALIERNYKKQSIERKIQSINDQRESELNNIKKEGDNLEFNLIEKIKSKIEFHETRIEQLHKEKEKEAVHLREKYAEQLNDETKYLRKILNN